jgi:hypothetical protein
MLMSKAMSYGQNFIKKKVCSGDVNSIKANAIRALEMMPASAVSTLIQQSPLCSGQGNMFGGKKAKTRKLQRKQRKTRKH